MHIPPIIFYSKINSTQDKAWEFYDKGLSNIVVLANEQSTGHGRHGRKWFSPRGGLWFSYLKTVNIQPELLDLISTACGVAVALSLRDLNLNALIKWPNDIIVNNKKIAGILISTKIMKNKITALVIGVGLNLNVNINVFPEELRGQITTVLNELKHYTDELKTLILILQKLDEFLDNIILNKATIHKYAKELNYLKDKHIKALLIGNKMIEDIVKDIDESGKLITAGGLALSIYDVVQLY
ncbi:MAG: biotin--[acetyl-CoA-carboxylase] ligase [Thermoprotei archaeon]|jgi:BirA family biotin operon repressor/biotin-[acetyl-CoA-carboxylase] ligase